MRAQSIKSQPGISSNLTQSSKGLNTLLYYIYRKPNKSLLRNVMVDFNSYLVFFKHLIPTHRIALQLLFLVFQSCSLLTQHRLRLV